MANPQFIQVHCVANTPFACLRSTSVKWNAKPVSLQISWTLWEATYILCSNGPTPSGLSGHGRHGRTRVGSPFHPPHRAHLTHPLWRWWWWVRRRGRRSRRSRSSWLRRCLWYHQHRVTNQQFIYFINRKEISIIIRKEMGLNLMVMVWIWVMVLVKLCVICLTCRYVPTWRFPNTITILRGVCWQSSSKVVPVLVPRDSNNPLLYWHHSQYWLMLHQPSDAWSSYANLPK